MSLRSSMKPNHSLSAEKKTSCALRYQNNQRLQLVEPGESTTSPLTRRSGERYAERGGYPARNRKTTAGKLRQHRSLLGRGGTRLNRVREKEESRRNRVSDHVASPETNAPMTSAATVPATHERRGTVGATAASLPDNASVESRTRENSRRTRGGRSLIRHRSNQVAGWLGACPKGSSRQVRLLHADPHHAPPARWSPSNACRPASISYITARWPGYSATLQNRQARAGLACSRGSCTHGPFRE